MNIGTPGFSHAETVKRVSISVKPLVSEMEKLAENVELAKEKIKDFEKRCKACSLVNDPVPEKDSLLFYCEYCEEEGYWDDDLECYRCPECGGVC